MAILMGFRSFLVVGLALTLISQAALAADYDPDGFHECILENIEGNMGKYAVIAVRQSCAHKHGTDAAGNKKPPKREPFSSFDIPKDSLFHAVKDTPEISLAALSNTEIVEYVRRQHFPDKTYKWVKDFLINSKVGEEGITR